MPDNLLQIIDMKAIKATHLVYIVMQERTPVTAFLDFENNRMIIPGHKDIPIKIYDNQVVRVDQQGLIFPLATLLNTASTEQTKKYQESFDQAYANWIDGKIEDILLIDDDEADE